MNLLGILVIALYVSALFFGLRHVAIVKYKYFEEKNGFSKKVFLDLLYVASMALLLYIILAARS